MVFRKTREQILRAKRRLRDIRNSPIERAVFKKELGKSIRRGAKKGVRSGLTFVDDIFENKGGRKIKKKAFGRIKDKSLLDGFF